MIGMGLRRLIALCLRSSPCGCSRRAGGVRRGLPQPPWGSVVTPAKSPRRPRAVADCIAVPRIGQFRKIAGEIPSSTHASPLSGEWTLQYGTGTFYPCRSA